MKKQILGRIQGTINENKIIGTIYKNTEFGVYGKIENENLLNVNVKDTIKVASRNEIKEGKAEIICQLDNNNKENYEIEIKRIYRNNNENNKSMLIEVTDERLLEKTGGIVQGMSGSPIVQNGKFVGAVTHVLVNNPKEGYAVFGDMMIKQMREIE